MLNVDEDTNMVDLIAVVTGIVSLCESQLGRESIAISDALIAELHAVFHRNIASAHSLADKLGGLQPAVTIRAFARLLRAELVCAANVAAESDGQPC